MTERCWRTGFHTWYDTPGRLQTVTDALTHAMTYGYDQFDRLVSRTDPLGKAETFTYDLLGNPSQRTDRKGQPTSRTYDLLNRPYQVSYADNSTITYTYDSGNRLTTIDDSLNGQITRTYDNLDRLTSETTAQGTISYTYDKADRRATMTVTGQPTVNYGTSPANRLTSLTQGSSVVTITYDDASRRSTLTLPNGIVTTYGYDNANQLTSLTYTLGQTTLGTLTYTYDLAGRRTQVGGTWARTGLPEAVASATDNAADRLTQWGTVNPSYDANGNLASDGLTSYLWDVRDQLSTVVGAIDASFGYDGTSRRIRKTVNGQTVYLLYDREKMTQELAGGVPSANLMNGLDVDEVFQRVATTETVALVSDAAGSTIGLSDSQGAIQTQYGYEPFGQTTSSGADSGNSLQFVGRERDAQDLYFYRARYYLAGLGRFLSEDPARSSGANLYAYAADSPIDNSDPTGLYTVRTQNKYLAGRIDSAMSIVKSELEEEKNCKCVEYFSDLGVDIKTWTSPGGPPYIGSVTYRQSTIGGNAQDRPPFVWLWVNEELFTRQFNPCGLGSVLLHEMGHLARKDTFDNEPSDFFKRCNMGCINPGSWR